MNYEPIDDTENNNYSFDLGKFRPRMEHIKAKDKIYLTHTEVPAALEGQGVGTELVRQVLEDIKKKELTLVPLCPFVAAYIKKHPQWRELVLKGINIA